jgi:excinuclease UvrABC nuclease subunit
MTFINPERIQLLALPWLPFAQRQDLPTHACIYFMLDDAGQVLYIGKTINLHNRIATHHRLPQLRACDGCRIAWLLVTDATLLTGIEMACIDYFQPAWNHTLALRNGDNKCTTSLRLSRDALRLLKQLATYHGLSMAGILEMLIRQQAKKEDVR